MLLCTIRKIYWPSANKTCGTFFSELQLKLSVALLQQKTCLHKIQVISERLKYLNMWTLEEKHNQSDLSKVFRMYKRLSMASFDCMFTVSNNTTTRGHSMKLVKNRCRLNLKQHFFSEQVTDCWNLQVNTQHWKDWLLRRLTVCQAGWPYLLQLLKPGIAVPGKLSSKNWKLALRLITHAERNHGIYNHTDAAMKCSHYLWFFLQICIHKLGSHMRQMVKPVKPICSLLRCQFFTLDMIKTAFWWHHNYVSTALDSNNWI